MCCEKLLSRYGKLLIQTTIGFKVSFPFWFKGEFGKALPRPLNHDGNPQRALLGFPRLGYPYSPSDLLTEVE